LAGLDPTAPVDGLALVRVLDERLRTDRGLHALPGKFGFLVDDGGRIGLGDVAADIRLTGVKHARGPRVTIALGGDGDEAR
ncbi:hypothetical protein NL509_28445, partial [Klebsiella pneumoniae]|nr:hypothetical protein [Klebsiella pneumoniae]